MIKEIWDDLVKRANYARACRDLNIMHEVYGEAKMARKMCAITQEQFMQLDEKLVKNGINKPSSYDN